MSDRSRAANTAQLPLMLLPGMGADARMFREQLAAFPQLRVATWIPPERHETLPHYAQRMVDQWEPSAAGFIGGASLGGAVALEMACLIRPVACFLIGSLRSPDELPPIYRRLSRLTAAAGWLPLLSTMVRFTAGFGLGKVSRGALRQLSATDGRFLQWATRALLDWNPSAGCSQVEIRQIHGQRDRIIPAQRSRAESILPGAGHLISITHPNELNQFMRIEMERCSGSAM